MHTFVKADTAVALERAENEIATVLVHLIVLLRIKNWLISPLLRLPTEIIVHILSYIMEDVVPSSVWRPIFSTCHRIHNIMCVTAKLWRKADFALDKLAHIAFLRSQGNLEAITVDFLPQRDEHLGKALPICRDSLVLHGHRFRSLEVSGYPSNIPDFSWILERPLTHLEHVKINIFVDDSISDPLFLQLPADLPLQVLDLANVVLPWSFSLLTGLRELHLDFRDCDSFVEISEEELLKIFEASPRLESLSLRRLLLVIPVVDGHREYTPTRIVRLSSLASLVLDSFPWLVGYTLACMDIPVITSLWIRAEFEL